MLFDILVDDNVNYNPMSPYTFYDVTCPRELPVKAKAKRQIGITLGLPGNSGQAPADISSACSCLITSGPADKTITATVTVTSVRVTITQVVTSTVSARGS